MNIKEGIGIYKLGQKVALYGYIDAINIEDVNDIENTTTLLINTPVKTISVNPKYEAVTTNLNKPKSVVPQAVCKRGERMNPKFRAWTEEGEVMYYDVYPFEDDTLLLSYDEIAFDEVPASDFILMQSTGLKDKKGEEIFEGDIVIAWSQGVKGTFEIKRRIDGLWLLYPAWKDGQFWYLSPTEDGRETIEIIGNIYENHELLEG